MKSVFMLMAAMMTAILMADEPEQRKADSRRRPMPQPVYAPQEQDLRHDKKREPSEMTPEERQKFNAARKRRFEIMVLINAYKIMPENERSALHSELLKRIREDFQAMNTEQKERIAKAEADLAKLRQELKNRESRREELIAKELDRLLKMPMMPRRNPRREINKKP